jgi:RNA polymerase sigma-70 factor, ECF subfamily
LPPEYRTVFVLRDVEKLSNLEVAKVLGISLATVKARVHRARLYMRNQLVNYFSGRSA